MKILPPQTFADLVGFERNWTLSAHSNDLETHGTTVISLRYDGGVLTLADRRATMSNLIMYDQADKIMSLDDRTVVAISGSFARSIEVCRMLKHSFKYYERMYLTEMSADGKVQEVSRALANNLPMAMQGVGLFLPILSIYNPEDGQFQIFFFDSAGAKFASANYAAAGSGSERIRGVMEYLSRTEKPWASRKMEDVLHQGLMMLDIAADLDSATGGFSKIAPMVQVLDKNGTRPLDGGVLAKAIARISPKS
jgi:proteasome beta subunit